MNKLDLSPSNDSTLPLLLSDSEAILSRELFTELRKRGHSAGTSLKIVHTHNGYEKFRELPITNRFRRV